MKVYKDIFSRIISPEHLFASWEEFRKGKTARKDVQAFEWDLERRIFELHRELQSGQHRHGPYSAFTICDPKQRRIHKATVRDRIVHHAVFSVLNPIFEPTFISHSFSCRKDKGTHKAVATLERMLWKRSKNHARQCFALKCDIHQFFASVDHAILLRMLGRKIKDERAIRLLERIIESFTTSSRGTGVPIGNLTSQLFANIYLNEFDQWMKHALKIRHFIRYTDDFVVLGEDKTALEDLVPQIRSYLQDALHLDLHPRKVSIRRYLEGIDFLGYVLLPHYRQVRTKTRRRMFRKMRQKQSAYEKGEMKRESMQQSFQSYLGVLIHADTYLLSNDFRNQYGWLMNDMTLSAL